jgi:hypothetical protein
MVQRLFHSAGSWGGGSVRLVTGVCDEKGLDEMAGVAELPAWYSFRKVSDEQRQTGC